MILGIVALLLCLIPIVNAFALFQIVEVSQF